MAAKTKTGGAMGSALPDPVKDSAAIAPIPAPAIENKPAPGQTGPKGMSPRTTYSRVNTGSPPVMDAGATAQKSGPPRGMEFLPAKVASSRGPMTMKERPLLQDMVKAAMVGTSQRLAINIEAVKQAAQTSLSKTASASQTRAAEGHVSTEYATKLASGLSFIGSQLRKLADLGPGEGPNALRVMEATSSETNIDAGESGQATAANQPPRDPPLQAEKVQQGNAGTGLQTNDETTHPEQPVSPIKNASVMAMAVSNMARLAKVAFAITPKGHEFDAKLNEMKARHVAERMALGEEFGAHRFGGEGEVPEEAGGAMNRLLNIARFGTSEQMAGGDPRHLEYAAKKHQEGSNAWNPLGGTLTPSSHEQGGTALQIGSYKQPGAGASKTAAPIALLRQLCKTAEDAINPAQISSPANVDPKEPPPGASASEEDVPAEPADVTSQKRLISSNQAAIDYTKGQAKANPKSDVNQLLTEPALSSSTDKVLERTLDNTGAAGVKISSAQGMRKTAAQVGAQRVLLSRLLEKAGSDATEKAKELPGKNKGSMGMAPTTPQAATGANAATMGM